jgi:hypothetical protein
LIGTIDFVSNPEAAMRNAFKTAKAPGPRFTSSGYAKSAIRPRDIGSPEEIERLRREGLATLERVQQLNSSNRQERD